MDAKTIEELRARLNEPQTVGLWADVQAAFKAQALRDRCAELEAKAADLERLVWALTLGGYDWNWTGGAARVYPSIEENLEDSFAFMTEDGKTLPMTSELRAFIDFDRKDLRAAIDAAKEERDGRAT